MKKTALAWIAAALFCSAASASASGPWSRLEGQHSRISTRRAVAVADAAAWEKVWREHAADAPVPPVDFSAESVVAVFLGEIRDAGVKIEIVVQNDMLDADRLNVFYREFRSASQPFAAQVVCRPFVMVKVRKTAVVSIEADGRSSIPENSRIPANPRDDSKVRALLQALPSFDGR